MDTLISVSIRDDEIFAKITTLTSFLDVMFLGENAIVKLPSFRPISNCSFPQHPIQELKYAITGLVDGKIMTCGG